MTAFQSASHACSQVVQPNQLTAIGARSISPQVHNLRNSCYQTNNSRLLEGCTTEPVNRNRSALFLTRHNLYSNYLASELLCNSIFGFDVCTLACGQTVGSLQSFFASPYLGRGWVALPLNQAASKINTRRYASQVVENNLALVRKMEKSTLMQR